MSAGHAAAANYHIVHRRIDAAPVLIPSGLQGDAIIAGLEDAVLDEHIAA